MKRINKVAVLGSGVMGSGIACHFANIGLDVLLLDIVPFDLTEAEKTNPAARNRIVNTALAAALKSKPAPIYEQKFASRIKTGNFEDDMAKIKDCDWIIEVVVERLDIKQQVFAKVDALRKKGSFVTSNTSGIPINMMAEGRSDDFQRHFCGTHFFNPPRYLRLLEVIPHSVGAGTDQSVVDFFMDYGDKFLGKRTVLCKDTPAFIANRVGVYAMAKIFQLTTELGLTVEEVDKITGPAIGRPNTGTFRLADLVGLDTADKVTHGIVANCPNDEQAGSFATPKYIEFLLENKFLGNKSGQGFYKKDKTSGSKEILALNLETLEYAPSKKVSIASLEQAKQVEDLAPRFKQLFHAKDKAGELVRQSNLGLFAYVSNRVPEIADHLYSVDDALRAGFAWEAGPFQYWDMIGVATGVEMCEVAGYTIGAWVKEMLAAGNSTFYKVENGVPLYYNIETKSYTKVPGNEGLIVLDNIREKPAVWKNAECTIHDLGDGVLCVEFRSKMNTIGGGVLEGINKAIEIAENEGWQGVVIGNNSTNFSVGANLMMVAMMAYEQEWDELNFAVKYFQDTAMRCRYSAIPVVAATQGYVFGGACEITMHCDAAIVAAESYIGLVEVGVGILPGGAGTKEFALRASDRFFKGDVQIPTLIEQFSTIAMAKVATSADEAFTAGYLLAGRDKVAVNGQRNIAMAKAKVLQLADGYVRPIERTDVTVLGRTGLGALYTAGASLQFGNYASEHDIKIAKKIAYVLCGGDLTSVSQVSERYLLDLEREAFMSLVAEPKSLDRIQHMLTKNKPLRN
jgi:3-hydroxyacyl-CoA dehydrogenase